MNVLITLQDSPVAGQGFHYSDRILNRFVNSLAAETASKAIANPATKQSQRTK